MYLYLFDNDSFLVPSQYSETKESVWSALVQSVKTFLKGVLLCVYAASSWLQSALSLLIS